MNWGHFVKQARRAVGCAIGRLNLATTALSFTCCCVLKFVARWNLFACWNLYCTLLHHPALILFTLYIEIIPFANHLAKCPFLGLFFTPGILACFPAGDQLHMLLRVEICTLLKSRRVLHLHVMLNSNFEAVEMKLNKTFFKTLCGPFLPKSVLISRWWPVTSYLAMLYFATLQHRLWLTVELHV